jgi:DNA-binding beta-propeller fold protein YncE
MHLARFLQRFRRETSGVAAIEMAFVTTTLSVAALNAVEIGRYAFDSMEAGQATQAGAQAAYVACDDQHLPATTACPNLNTAVTRAIQSTSLGSDFTLKSITEGYYCIDGGTHALVKAGDVGSKPANCSAFGNSSLSPALYLQVNTSFTYQPLFGTLTIGATLPKTVDRSSWMRMI